MQREGLMSGTPGIHVDILNAAQREVIAHLGKALAHTDFYLAGGTAAALQLGHRSSMDLDWFIDKNRDIGHVVRSLVYFADAEGEPPLKMIKPVIWQDLNSDFEQWVKDLASFYPRQ
jgi:hypothetical protein